MRRVALYGLLALAVLAAIMAIAYALLRPRAMAPGEPGRTGSNATGNATTPLITAGEYLARAGDCVACHTAPDGREFAGGRAMPTPFGNIYVPNITPDDDTGIGHWNADDFYRMMHTGVSRDGSLLYPAMPFASCPSFLRAP